MTHLFEGGSLMYVVLGLVPNLIVMLWVMARMHRDLRLVTVKLGIIESDNKILDEGLKALAEEVRHYRMNDAGNAGGGAARAGGARGG
jgi:hypothetical protein